MPKASEELRNDPEVIARMEALARRTSETVDEALSLARQLKEAVSRIPNGHDHWYLSDYSSGYRSTLGKIRFDIWKVERDLGEASKSWKRNLDSPTYIGNMAAFSGVKDNA